MDFNEVQKTLFLGIFGPKFAQENFFSKNELIHILDIVILRLRKKNQKNLMDGFLSKSKKPYFWAFLGPNWPKKIFFLKMYSFIFWTLFSTTLCKKSEKSDGWIFLKVQKTLFWAFLGPNWPKKIFFQKSGSVTFCPPPFFTFVPKIKKFL